MLASGEAKRSPWIKASPRSSSPIGAIESCDSPCARDSIAHKGLGFFMPPQTTGSAALHPRLTLKRPTGSKTLTLAGSPPRKKTAIRLQKGIARSVNKGRCRRENLLCPTLRWRGCFRLGVSAGLSALGYSVSGREIPIRLHPGIPSIQGYRQLTSGTPSARFSGLGCA